MKTNKYLWFQENRTTILLIAIMVLATALRLYGIRFGLPFTYHVDEPPYVSAALNLGAGNVGRQLNPPVLPNLLFVEYGAYYVVERLSGHISSTVEFEKMYRHDPSMFFLLGRLTMAFMGVFNTLVVYLIGKRASGQFVGLLAALFLAISFLHVRDSHFAVPDVMMTCLVTVCILFCLLAIDSTNNRFFYFAAFFSGMAIATKWSAWSVIVPLGYVFIIREYKTREHFSPGRVVAYAWIALVCLLAGFFLPAFQLLLKPDSYLAYALIELRSGSSGGFGIWQIDTVPGYLFYLKTLWYGVGIGLLIFGAIGFIRHIWLVFTSRNEASVLLLLFPLIYYLIMGATRHYFARYALPLIPFLVIFAGEAVFVVAKIVETRWKKMGSGLLVALVVVTSAQPLLNSLRFDFLMTQVDTRTIAKKWIEENIPKGSKIALDWPIHGPSLNANDYGITIEGDVGLARRSIEHYRQEGFDYLIASSFIYNIPTVFENTNAERKVFYTLLDDDFELVKEFRPSIDSGEIPFVFDEIYGPVVSLWQRERPGPTLNIYRLLK